MQKIKAVIFDIDGTLANTVPLCVQAFRQAMEPQLHRPLSDEEIIASFGPDEEGTIESFKPKDSMKALSDFMHYYTSLHAAMCPQPFDGIEDLLEILKQKKVHLAIATGKGKDTIALSLKIFGIASCFEIVEHGAPEGSRKPEAMEHIVHTLGVQKSEVIYVGDSAGDIKESHQAGIAAVAAAWAATADKRKLEEEQPDAMFNTVEDFAAWLKQKL